MYDDTCWLVDNNGLLRAQNLTFNKRAASRGIVNIISRLRGEKGLHLQVEQRI